ncbi:TraU family protein [Vibrio agarivorans]|uniref:TraU family protein n=1 Tax=Vibrio agarivorans TaxID=153622 RepID=A0ABT7Y7H6_9VIBR|nr:TraU family protein [Vibrio agarivorans]MDN2483948.1 TraU family protein [Vibrio agarivorans]
MFRSRKTTTALLISSLSVSANVNAFSFPSFGDLLGALTGITDLIPDDSWFDFDYGDLDLGYGDIDFGDHSDSAWAAAVEYLGGARPDMNALTRVINDSSSAGNDMINESQSSPTGIFDDAWADVTANIDHSCHRYRMLGFCFSWRPGLIPRFYSYPVGQNRYPDQHVEVTANVPGDGESFFSAASNAPTDIFTGDLLQSGAAEFGRMTNISGGYNSSATKLQTTPNQAEQTDKTNPYLFREVMIMGNPSLMPHPYSMMPGFCTGSTTPYIPYFHSALDHFSWRMLATTETVMLGTYMAEYGGTWNNVGRNFGGSVFPRMGFIEEHDQYRANVIAAFRAISIVNDTRSRYSGLAGFHVYKSVSPTASGSWGGGDDSYYRMEHDHTTFRLRETYPEQASTCSDYTWSLSEVERKSESFRRNNKDGSMALKVYRPYVCCRKRGRYLETVAASPSF